MALELSAQTSSAKINIKGNLHNTQEQQNVVGLDSRKNTEDDLESACTSNINGSTGSTTPSTSANNTSIHSTQGYTINGNLTQSDNTGTQVMPDGTRSQDQFSGMTSSASQHPHHHNHEDASSCLPSSSAPLSSPVTYAAEQVTSSDMNNSNSKNMVKEQKSASPAAADTSGKPQVVKDTSGCDEESSGRTVDCLVDGEAKTIPKEDGLADIIIQVPVLQRPQPCKESGAKVKSHNGHSALRSGNQQMRKRPVLVRKATPVKIEVPVKIFNDKIKSMSRENSFAEEEEDEVEAEGFST